jgi:small subunit ribosomal protein S16
MAVKIRLKRMGRSHLAYYRLGAMDIRSPRDGRMLEELGTYDPSNKDVARQVTLNKDRIEFWLKNGATPTATVGHLLAKNGIGKK